MSFNESSLRSALLSPVLHYVLLVIACTLILTYRSPALVLHANFYAEDGSVFIQNIINNGFVGSILSTFNGYFIIGLYLISELALIINFILGDSVLTLPAILNLTAITFMAAAICLPYILFRDVFGRAAMLLVALLSSLVPLYQSSFVVIGTVGNQKFIFFYLAFLLIMYRCLKIRSLSFKKLLAVDVTLLLCLYTNTAVYLLLPAVLAPYALDFISQVRKKRPIRRPLNTLLGQPGLISAAILCIASLPQIAIVLVNGIPDLPGYLDTPYNSARTIEIFGNRTLLFGLTHTVNEHLGDLRVISILLLVTAAVIFGLRKNKLLVFIFGVYAALVASIIFVVNRPGVSDFFMGYRLEGSGPDQFFYAQTLVMYPPLVLLLFGLFSKVRDSRIRHGLLVIGCGLLIISHVVPAVEVASRVQTAGTYENSNDTLYDQVIVQCKSRGNGSNNLKIKPYTPVGPNPAFQMSIPKDNVCNSDAIRGQHPSISYTGLSSAVETQYKVEEGSQIYQRFKAVHDDLHGIKLLVSNYGKENRTGSYELVVYDGACRSKLASSPLASYSADNSFQRIHFPPIADSEGKEYCFSVKPSGDTFDPIAVSLSQDNLYQPRLSIDNEPQTNDVVFDILYANDYAKIL